MKLNNQTLRVDENITACQNSDVSFKNFPVKCVNIIGLLTKDIKNADEYKRMILLNIVTRKTNVQFELEIVE